MYIYIYICIHVFNDFLFSALFRGTPISHGYSYLKTPRRLPFSSGRVLIPYLVSGCCKSLL